MTKTIYIKNGNSYNIYSSADLDIQDKLPPYNFIVKQDNYKNFYLEITESFIEPKKVYGDANTLKDKMLNTYKLRDNSTGVLLVGEKGSGKSLLAKLISIQAAKENIPTIIVTTEYADDDFFSFIQSINQPCVVLFDEFEKVYKKETQQAILTLLDGVYPTKKLFIFTANSLWKLDDNLINRPGRIYYLKEYSALEKDFIIEYCSDVLTNKNYLDDFIKVQAINKDMNFDMLQALVEEVNRYNCSPLEAIKLINILPEKQSSITYEVKLTKKNKQIKTDYEKWTGNPFDKNEVVSIDVPKGCINFKQNQITKFDPITGIINYKDDDYNLTLTPIIKENFNFAF